MAELVARGYTNDQIAEELGITTHTVKNYVSDIYGYLYDGAEGQATRVRLALDWIAHTKVDVEGFGQ